MNKVLCSTGAVIGRPNGRDLTLLRSCLENLRCDGYEFMMYSTWYDELDAVRNIMIHFPAPVPVFHIEKHIGDLISRNAEGDTAEAFRLFGINCALADEIGAEKLVLHLWSGIDSDKDMLHNIECYRSLREISDRYGLMLTVENVVCNHADPFTNMIALAKEFPDISFTFDTKMAEFHGQIDLLYAEENRWLVPYIKHMHINDYKGGYMDWSSLRTLHPGDGQVDFGRLFEFIRSIRYSGDFTVEATSFDQSGVIDFDSLNRSFDMIRGLMGNHGSGLSSVSDSSI